MTLNSVLVATDFSDSVRHAALRAATLARELGAQKGVLLHVALQLAAVAAFVLRRSLTGVRPAGTPARRRAVPSRAG